MRCLAAVMMFSSCALGATVGSAHQSSLDLAVQGQLSALVPFGDAETPLIATKIAKAAGVTLGFEEGARLPHCDRIGDRAAQVCAAAAAEPL